MDPSINLSVVIVSWNVQKMLDDCLNSVEEATRGLSTEIFVVDNASLDGSQQMVAVKHPSVSLICNSQNRGFGPANNQALRLCHGEFILILNPDTLISSEAVNKLIGFMMAHPQAGLAGPEQCDQWGILNFINLTRNSPREMAEYLIERILSLDSPQVRIIFNKPRKVPLINAACWILRKKAIPENGLFDDDLFLFGEEKYVLPALRRNGWETWFVRDAMIVHYRHQSLRKCYPYLPFFYHLESWVKRSLRFKPVKNLDARRDLRNNMAFLKQ